MISMESVCFRYDKKDILNDINLTVDEGEQLLLIGANGSGKSTLLSLLSGLYNPYKGTIKIDELDYKNNEREIKKIVGIMFQEPLGFKNSKVIEILDFFKVLNDDKISLDEVMKLTNTFNLKEKKIGLLSGGERQKVALAISLLGDPKYLLLDEPMSALDVPSRKEFISIIKKLKEQGKTIIIVSHILEDLQDCFNKVVLVKDSKIKYYGKIDKLLSELKYKYVVEINDYSHNIDLKRFEKFRNDEDGNMYIYCQSEIDLDEVYKVFGKIGLKTNAISLNDIFYLID